MIIILIIACININIYLKRKCIINKRKYIKCGLLITTISSSVKHSVDIIYPWYMLREYFFQIRHYNVCVYYSTKCT